MEINLYLRLIKPMNTFDEECGLAGSGTNVVLYLAAILPRVGGFGKEESQRGGGVVFDHRAVGTRQNFLLVFEPFDGQWWSSREQNIEMDL